MTLIEVMIALAVLAIGLLAMLAMQVSAMRSGKYGRHTTQAAQLARDQMEYLHRLDWADPLMAPTAWTAPTFMGTAGPVNVVVQSANGPQQEMNYTVSHRITNDAVDANLRLLDVRVNWTELNAPAGAPPRRYAMSTIRHNDP
jgi:prepilin-type N-terminal cleavage/methylation domain-containing protein